MNAGDQIVLAHAGEEAVVVLVPLVVLAVLLIYKARRSRDEDNERPEQRPDEDLR